MESNELFPDEPPRAKAATLRLDELPADGTKPPGYLVDSIKRRGVMVPVIVLDHGDDGYTVLEGRRRIAAARRARFVTIPAMIYDADDIKHPDAYSVALNQEREPNPVVEFDAIASLHRQGFDEATISRATALTMPSVRFNIRLLGLPTEILDGLRAGKVRFSVCRKILRTPKDVQGRLAKWISVRGSLGARDVAIAKVGAA